MKVLSFDCCKCCEEGVDPDLHTNSEFKGHDIGCDSCRNYKEWKPKGEKNEGIKL